jgi:hypothetical protein
MVAIVAAESELSFLIITHISLVNFVFSFSLYARLVLEALSSILVGVLLA